MLKSYLAIKNQIFFHKKFMTRKNSPKKTCSINRSVWFYVWKKYELCTCTNVCVKPVQNGKNISFCILVSDKKAHDLATSLDMMYISRHGCSKHSPPSINSGSLQKDALFTQKYIWQYNNSNQKSLSSRYDS